MKMGVQPSMVNNLRNPRSANDFALEAMDPQILFSLTRLTIEGNRELVCIPTNLVHHNMPISNLNDFSFSISVPFVHHAKEVLWTFGPIWSSSS